MKFLPYFGILGVILGCLIIAISTKSSTPIKPRYILSSFLFPSNPGSEWVSDANSDIYAKITKDGVISYNGLIPNRVSKEKIKITVMLDTSTQQEVPLDEAWLNYLQQQK